MALGERMSMGANILIFMEERMSMVIDVGCLPDVKMRYL